MRSHYCGVVDAGFIDQEVTLCGWVHRRRDHGGVIFIDLRDREGLIQVVIDPDTPDIFSIAEQVRNEFVLKITGRVRARPAGTTNDDMPTGQIEVLAKDLVVLNATLICVALKCRSVCSFGLQSRKNCEHFWTPADSLMLKLQF